MEKKREKREVGEYAFAADPEKGSDIAKEREREKEIARKIDKKSTANVDKWPNDHGGLARVLFPRRGP